MWCARSTYSFAGTQIPYSSLAPVAISSPGWSCKKYNAGGKPKAASDGSDFASVLHFTNSTSRKTLLVSCGNMHRLLVHGTAPLQKPMTVSPLSVPFIFAGVLHQVPPYSRGRRDWRGQLNQPRSMPGSLQLLQQCNASLQLVPFFYPASYYGTLQGRP